MLTWTLAFLAFALLAALCGFSGMALGLAGLARVAAGVFLVLSGVSLFGARGLSR